MGQFDAIKSVNELMATNLSRENSETIVRLIQTACNDSITDGKVATKSDIFLLNEKINNLEIKLVNQMTDIVKHINGLTWKIFGMISAIMGLFITLQHFIK